MFRRLWLKFELWRHGICTEHGVTLVYNGNYGTWRCAECDNRKCIQRETFARERQQRIERLLQEFHDDKKN